MLSRHRSTDSWSKKKDIPCIELPQFSDRKVVICNLPLLVFCGHLRKSIKTCVLIIFYSSKNDLKRLFCCKQNKKCKENKTLSIYVFILLFEKRLICKLVTPGPILSCQLSIKRLFFTSDISSMAIALTVNNRRLSR